MGKINGTTGWALCEKRGGEWAIWIGMVRRTRAEIIDYARHNMVMPHEVGKPWAYVKKRYGFKVVQVSVEARDG